MNGGSAFGICTVAANCQAGSTGGAGGEMNGPAGVATDVQGDVYVADAGNNRIQKFRDPVLHASLAGLGTGTVTGTGIPCPGACSQSYVHGTVVTLSATPTSGSTFVGWSGGGCAGTGDCTVTMSSDQTVTATFNAAPPGTHTLTVVKAGSGSGTVTSGPAGIDCGSACDAAFTSGTQVTLTATPAFGSVFAGWGGACTGSTQTCKVTLSADQSVTASFRAMPVVGGLSLSPQAFKPAAGGPSTQPVSRRSNRGAVVRFTLNQPATVRFTLEQQLPGRKIGKGKHRAASRRPSTTRTRRGARGPWRCTAASRSPASRARTASGSPEGSPVARYPRAATS